MTEDTEPRKSDSCCASFEEHGLIGWEAVQFNENRLAVFRAREKLAAQRTEGSSTTKANSSNVFKSNRGRLSYFTLLWRLYMRCGHVMAMSLVKPFTNCNTNSV